MSELLDSFKKQKSNQNKKYAHFLFPLSVSSKMHMHVQSWDFPSPLSHQHTHTQVRSQILSRYYFSSYYGMVWFQSQKSRHILRYIFSKLTRLMLIFFQICEIRIRPIIPNYKCAVAHEKSTWQEFNLIGTTGHDVHFSEQALNWIQHLFREEEGK